MINKVEICGVNTSKLPVLSNEEKNRLLNEIKKGNKEAREEFINGNLKLVLSVIKRFYGRGENLDDLFQIGCIGLIKAMDNFDLDLNVQFSTYAVPMIAGEIRRYLRDNNMVRVSRSVRDLAYKVLAVREKALRENKKEPTIDEIAKEAEFFSFGTNDLTQMTYGFSRDDAAKFLNEYYTKNIFESDPFAHIDENGVGQLMQIAINKAKPVRPDIKLGICGEHGGDPRTVEFCHRIGLTYVSCSPYRVPLARLAAAQAAVKEKMGK